MSEVLNINRRHYHKWKKQPLNETQKQKIIIQLSHGSNERALRL